MKVIVKEDCTILHNGKHYGGGDEIEIDDLNEGVLPFVEASPLLFAQEASPLLFAQEDSGKEEKIVGGGIEETHSSASVPDAQDAQNIVPVPDAEQEPTDKKPKKVKGEN